jgi:prefoldin subunit 5
MSDKIEEGYENMRANYAIHVKNYIAAIRETGTNVLPLGEVDEIIEFYDSEVERLKEKIKTLRGYIQEKL